MYFLRQREKNFVHTVSLARKKVGMSLSMVIVPVHFLISSARSVLFVPFRARILLPVNSEVQLELKMSIL